MRKSAARRDATQTGLPLTPKMFGTLAAAYQRDFALSLTYVTPDGTILYGKPGNARCRNDAGCHESRRRAVSEALRWGEPCVNLCPSGFIIWGIPVMNNSVVSGGLTVIGAAGGLEAEGRQLSAAQIRRACQGLLEMAEKHNLTNSAYLQLRRLEAGRERERAEAIHVSKTHAFDDIRAVYLYEEPALLAAIKRGDKQAAREIINRVLVAIYHLGRNHLDLLKSFTLELVVMMYRAAVQAGGEPSRLFGVNYSSVAALTHIQDEEALCHWLTSTLEHLIDAIRDNRQYPNTVLLGNALRYMQEHVGQDISRNQVAQAAGLSPSHFSHLVRQKMGRTFTDLLAEYRVNRACELLLRSDRRIGQVALACGFCDQSYFTKVFRRYTGATPRQYRDRLGEARQHESV